MIFTEDSKHTIKTNENDTPEVLSRSQAYKKFIAGQLDENYHTSTDRESKINEQRLALLQLIQDRYPMDFGPTNNYDRYTTHELESIAEYGDHRAAIDPEHMDIDYSPTYHQDRNGVATISHNQVDLKYQDKHQEKVAKQIGGFGIVRSLRYTKPKVEDSKHLARMEDYRRILKGLPIKYQRVAKFILAEKLEEIARASMGYYNKKARQYLAAIVMDCMNNSKESFVAKLGKDEICHDFSIEKKRFFTILEEVRARFDFLKPSLETDVFTHNRKQIKQSAHNLIYQLAQEGYIAQPRIVNEFVDEIDNHYPNIFNIKHKKTQMIALIATKLFDAELETSDMALSFYNYGMCDEDKQMANQLHNQIISWMRREDHQIKNDVISGRIRDLYLPEVEEFIVSELPQQEVLQQPVLVVETEVSDINAELGRPDRPTRPDISHCPLQDPPRPSFEFNYLPFTDQIVHQYRQEHLDYLIEQNLLDKKTIKKSIKEIKKNNLISNALAVDTPYDLDWDIGNYHPQSIDYKYNNPDIIPAVTKHRDDNNRIPNIGSYNPKYDPLHTIKGSLPTIGNDDNMAKDTITYDYCYLGYPGALTRWLTYKTTEKKENKPKSQTLATSSQNLISSIKSSEMGQNPSIVWLTSKHSFFERADQVMMKRDGLFGKWKQYTNRSNVQFTDDINLQIKSVYQLEDAIDQIIDQGSIGNTEKLEPGSVVVFPDMRDILHRELEAAVLQMAPKDFVRMKQKLYENKIIDMEMARAEKIKAYQSSIEKESQRGIYQKMSVKEIKIIIDDFTQMQNKRFDDVKSQMRTKLKDDIDEFINAVAKLSQAKQYSKEAFELHKSLFHYGVIMNEEIKYYYNELRRKIDLARTKRGVTVILGGILSKHIKTSQLLRDNTINVDDILDNTAEQVLDQHLIKLCLNQRELNDHSLRQASLLSTNIPDKLSISSFKLAANAQEKAGLMGSWDKQESVDISEVVEWIQ